MKYRRRLPPEVHALVYDGTNLLEIEMLTGGRVKETTLSVIENGDEFGVAGIEIQTAGGFVTALVGEYIVRSSDGDVCRYKPKAFVDTFEPVTTDSLTEA